MREAFHHARLNFQRGLYRGKIPLVFLCLFLFFFAYFGGVRGKLLEYDQTINVMELFMAVTNNHYTAFTFWTGFVLLICDIPYREEGIYQCLLRTSKTGWISGQVIYVIGMTIVYFAAVFFILFLLVIPQVTFSRQWTDTFMRMVNVPQKYGISNWFIFPVSVIRSQEPLTLFGRCLTINFLSALAVSLLTFMVNLVWRSGPGIMIGGLALALDYCATVLFIRSSGLLYISPLTMSRVGNISSSHFDRYHPSFSYACLFPTALILGSLITIYFAGKKHEY